MSSWVKATNEKQNIDKVYKTVASSSPSQLELVNFKNRKLMKIHKTVASSST
jgi:hypothetical protein